MAGGTRPCPAPVSAAGDSGCARPLQGSRLGHLALPPLCPSPARPLQGSRGWERPARPLQPLPAGPAALCHSGHRCLSAPALPHSPWGIWSRLGSCWVSPREGKGPGPGQGRPPGEASGGSGRALQGSGAHPCPPCRQRDPVGRARRHHLGAGPAGGQAHLRPHRHARGVPGVRQREHHDPEARQHHRGSAQAAVLSPGSSWLLPALPPSVWSSTPG